MADIWIISDGKPGHQNQSLGLAEALVELKPELTFMIIPVEEAKYAFFSKSSPKLIISAGRATHLWNWLLSLRYSAKNAVLMRPSLPYACFDCVLIPEHDKPMASDRIVATKGAINRMKPAEKEIDSQIVLLGGPSKHVKWDSEAVLQEIINLSAGSSSPLRVAVSRRTPASLLDTLKLLEHVVLIKPDAVANDWLPQTLSTTDRVVVSSDSVSMVYEALTAGCAVSLITLESEPNSRTQRGVMTLLKQGLVVELGQPMNYPVTPFREATRCAQIILNKGWL